MSTYLVDLTVWVHRCPADPIHPHMVYRKQDVVGIIDGGPCQNPVTVQGRTLACEQIAVHENRCAACKTQIIVQNSRTVDLGFQGAASEIAATLWDEAGS